MTSADSPGSDFAGPGDVRARLRSLDWSRTGLGPPRSWSPVLRTMVGCCLASGFPMVIHWGPELVALYNDAFAALLGGKHPAAWAGRRGTPGRRLGRRRRPARRGDRHGHTLHAEDEQRILYRNGYPEECYFSYSHSPIDDVDGTTAGVFTVATETTAKVLYERRMRVVRELGAVSVTDAGSPAETCRAVLRVLATARETMPFAVAFLRRRRRRARAGSRTTALADGGPVCPGVDRPAPRIPAGADRHGCWPAGRVRGGQRAAGGVPGGVAARPAGSADPGHRGAAAADGERPDPIRSGCWWWG